MDPVHMTVGKDCGSLQASSEHRVVAVRRVRRYTSLIDLKDVYPVPGQGHFKKRGKHCPGRGSAGKRDTTDAALGNGPFCFLKNQRSGKGGRLCSALETVQGHTSAPYNKVSVCRA